MDKFVKRTGQTVLSTVAKKAKIAADNAETTVSSTTAVVQAAAAGGAVETVAASVTEFEGMPLTATDWAQALQPEFKKPYFVKLMAFLRSQHTANKVIYPPKQAVFSALNTCPLADVKVVILGQDPYHGPGQAHGLSFSVQSGVPQPPSLKNMIKEASSCCGIAPTKSGCLTPWADQGVLLLNTVLTVEKGQAMSHRKKGWEDFTDAVIKVINRSERPVVFMLWGKPSQEKGSSINRSKHTAITSSHPSPLGATKTSEPFIGSACFKRANDALIKHGQTPIDWNI